MSILILQLKPTTKYLNSKEYKLMLKVEIFKDKDKGIEKVIDIIKSKVKDQKGTFTEEYIPNDKSKKVWYLDTKNHELYKNNGLLTRVKENQDKTKYNVEFKIRNSDKSIASSYDLSNPEKSINYQFKEEKHKFEEDITTPFKSIYSESAEFKYKDISNLEKYKDIKSIYPSLDLKMSDKKEDLLKVNDFKATENNPILGKIEFANGNCSFQFRF